LSKKTGKDTFVKKTLTCETAAAPLCHKAIKKKKRVSFNPSTGLALSPSKKTLAPRKPTVRLYSTVKKKEKLDGYFKNITSGKPWTFFPHDATMINGVLVKILLFLPVRKIVATQIF
jgi:hypothetical protein